MKKGLTTVVVALAAALLLAPSASAIDKVDTKQLRKGVTLDGILEHERALQDDRDRQRRQPRRDDPGYDASVDYVVEAAASRAGYKVSSTRSTSRSGPERAVDAGAEVSPTARTFVEDTDYIVSQFSARRRRDGETRADERHRVPPPGGAGTGTSGCEPG